jgi:Siphovirus ReqiPepy6 Gp37-like protein
MITDNRNARSYYELWLLSDAGVRIASLDTVQSFGYTRAVNSAGEFSLTMPHTFDQSILAKDRRVAIYRKPQNGTMALDFMGVIEGITKAGRVPSRTVTGCGLNGLLDRRKVLYFAGSAQAQYTNAYADNAMKQIVRENLGSSATTGNGRKVTNSISSTYFTVEADTSLGSQIDKSFAFAGVGDTLRILSGLSRQAGTEVFFDIVPTTENAFEFRTFVTQRGADRRSTSGSQIVFGLEYGNLDEPVYSESWADEVNYAVAGGQAEEAARALGTAEDTTRSGVSIFGKTEGFINGTNIRGTDAAAIAALDDRAKELVNSGRPKRHFTARIVNTPGSAYGLQWGFGDYITVTYDDLQFDAMIKAVTVAIDSAGYEKIDARIEAYV